MEYDEIYDETLAMINKKIELLKEAVDMLAAGRREEYREILVELYLENVRGELSSVNSFLKNIIVHIFKYYYGNIRQSHDHLSDEIDTFRDQVADLLEWNLKRGPDKTMLKKVEDQLDLIYRRAVRDFGKIMKNDPSDYRVIERNELPKECPWSIAELIESDIADILIKLYGGFTMTDGNVSVEINIDEGKKLIHRCYFCGLEHAFYDEVFDRWTCVECADVDHGAGWI